MVDGLAQRPGISPQAPPTPANQPPPYNQQLLKHGQKTSTAWAGRGLVTWWSLVLWVGGGRGCHKRWQYTDNACGFCFLIGTVVLFMSWYETIINKCKCKRIDFSAVTYVYIVFLTNCHSCLSKISPDLIYQIWISLWYKSMTLDNLCSPSPSLVTSRLRDVIDSYNMEHITFFLSWRSVT